MNIEELNRLNDDELLDVLSQLEHDLASSTVSMTLAGTISEKESRKRLAFEAIAFYEVRAYCMRKWGNSGIAMTYENDIAKLREITDR